MRCRMLLLLLLGIFACAPAAVEDWASEQAWGDLDVWTVDPFTDDFSPVAAPKADNGRRLMQVYTPPPPAPPAVDTQFVDATLTQVPNPVVICPTYTAAELQGFTDSACTAQLSSVTQNPPNLVSDCTGSAACVLGGTGRRLYQASPDVHITTRITIRAYNAAESANAQSQATSLVNKLSNPTTAAALFSPYVTGTMQVNGVTNTSPSPPPPPPVKTPPPPPPVKTPPPPPPVKAKPPPPPVKAKPPPPQVKAPPPPPPVKAKPPPPPVKAKPPPPPVKAKPPPPPVKAKPPPPPVKAKPPPPPIKGYPPPPVKAPSPPPPVKGYPPPPVKAPSPPPPVKGYPPPPVKAPPPPVKAPSPPPPVKGPFPPPPVKAPTPPPPVKASTPPPPVKRPPPPLKKVSG